MSVRKHDVIQGITFDVIMTPIVSEEGSVSIRLNVKAQNGNFTGYKIVFVSGKVTTSDGNVFTVDSDIQKLWGRIHTLGRKRNAFSQTVTERLHINTDSIDITTNGDLTSLDRQIKAKAAELNGIKILLQGMEPTMDPEYMKVSNELTDLKTLRQQRIIDLRNDAILNSLNMEIHLTVR